MQEWKIETCGRSLRKKHKGWEKNLTIELL